MSDESNFRSSEMEDILAVPPKATSDAGPAERERSRDRARAQQSRSVASRRRADAQLRTTAVDAPSHAAGEASRAKYGGLEHC